MAHGSAVPLLLEEEALQPGLAWIRRRDRRAESPALAPVNHFEIVPVAYTMDLQVVVPSAEVRLYAVNPI